VATSSSIPPLWRVCTPPRRPTTRTVSIDLRHDWSAAVRDAGLDSDGPTAWIAEGLFGYLPPEAQDRVLDNITALSADGSRLTTETVPDRSNLDLEKAREMMRKAPAKWRDHGFELEFADLRYDGKRNEVPTYLENLGWRSVGTQRPS
jgi:methyltransferase (TIGR00027 family)